ncbi:MAG: glycosyltransferase family 87 protein [Myxococcota bacterium]
MRAALRAFGTKPTILVFVVVSSVYALLSWNRILQPSPQFHFIDLAHSILEGRLDTDAPEDHSSRTKDDDAPGYREALKRVEESGGWNDWSTIRKLTTKDGEVLMGRYPWEGESNDKRWLFYTNDNRELKITPEELARTCGENGRRLCDERIHYVSFPPVPALVFLPFVAVWGYDTNDVLITVLVGGLNAVLLFWFLQLLVIRGHSRRSTGDNLWLTFAFAFGTVAFFSSVRGEVWFTALVFGVALNLGFMLAALDLKHPIWAGIFLGLAFGTRTPILFCGIFFAWQLFFPGNRWFLRPDADGVAPEPRAAWMAVAKKAVAFGLPLAVILAGLAVYNEVRFGEYGEFGHNYLSGGAGDRVRDHGMFSFTYLNRNLLSGLVSMPRLLSDAPYVLVSNHGLGLLVTTPLFFYLMRPAALPPIRRALWLAVLVAAVPGFFYQNTGWIQIGYRFALDYIPYLMALLAVEDKRLGRTAKILIIVGILVNLFGAITFGRMGQFYYETVMPGAT